MKKLFFISTGLILFSAKAALAVCPVCTVAVIAGVGLSRWLGIDDTVTGVWIGGLVVSMVFWTINWMNKKNWRFKGRKILIWAGYLAIIIIPLYTTGIMGHKLNKIWGVDKLLAGIIFGMAGFIAGTTYYEYLKKKNGGHAHFSFQKIVMAVAPLVILGIIFYFITK